MRFPFILLFAVSSAAPLAAAPAGLAFVQATVVSRDAASGTLGFVDASGRNRSYPVSDAASSRVRSLRTGDEVILVLSGSSPVVQDVRVSQAAPAPPATGAALDSAAAPATTETEWTVVPAHQMRPTWPNPYSRYYKGPKPARR